MSDGGKPTYQLWIDGKSREYYKSDGKWRDKNGIDRSYLFDGQDNYLGLRNGKGYDKGKNKGMRHGKGKHKDKQTEEALSPDDWLSGGHS